MKLLANHPAFYIIYFIATITMLIENLILTVRKKRLQRSRQIVHFHLKDNLYSEIDKLGLKRHKQRKGSIESLRTGMRYSV